MDGQLLLITEARYYRQLFSSFRPSVPLNYQRKVVLIVTYKTKQTWSFLRLWILLYAFMFAIQLTSCQSFTDTTVKSKSAANEAAAIAAFRTISSAETAYSVTHDGDYGTFEDLVKAGNLDARFDGDKPVIGGYVLSIKTTSKDGDVKPASYSVNGDPQQGIAAGSTGTRHLYMDSVDSAIHVNPNQTAGPSDPNL